MCGVLHAAAKVLDLVEGGDQERANDPHRQPSNNSRSRSPLGYGDAAAQISGADIPVVLPEIPPGQVRGVFQQFGGLAGMTGESTESFVCASHSEGLRDRLRAFSGFRLGNKGVGNRLGGYLAQIDYV